MRNDTSFGSRVAANWCALVEHMNALSGLTESENLCAEPSDSPATIDHPCDEGETSGGH